MTFLRVPSGAQLYTVACVSLFLTKSTLRSVIHRSMCVVIPHEEYSALSYTP
jgi:hypothetical protein